MRTDVNFYETPPYPFAVHVVCEWPLKAPFWISREMGLRQIEQGFFLFLTKFDDTNLWKHRKIDKWMANNEEKPFLNGLKIRLKDVGQVLIH